MKYLQHSTTLTLLVLTITSFAQTNTRLKRVTIERYDMQQSKYISDDSIVYYYTAGNHGIIPTSTIIGASNPFLHFNPMNYFTSMAYDSAVLFERQKSLGYPSQRNIQTINTNSRIVSYDQFRLNTVNKLVHTDTIQNIYTNNTLTRRTTSKWGGGRQTAEFIYNTSNMLDTVKTTYVSGGVSTIVYSYDATNRLVQVHNMYVSPKYSGQTKTNYIYTLNQNLPDFIVTTRNTINPPQFDTTSLKAFTYNTNNDLVQEQLWEYNWPGQSSPILTYQLDVQYNNQNKRITDVIWEDFFKHGPQYAGFVKHLRKQYTYTQNDKLDTYNIDQWDSTTNSWKPRLDTALGAASKTKFEYEVYWPTSITEHQNTADLTLYPSPASDFITVEVAFDKENTFVATILDIQGRVLMQWEESTPKNYKKAIPLTELPSGTYILKLSGEDVHYSKQFSITK